MARDRFTWKEDLQAEDSRKSQALSDLREILAKILPKALTKWLPPSDPHFGPLIEDVIQETLLRVLSKLDTFEGRSKFTTWVYTIGIRIALTKLRLRKWREASLDEIESGNAPNLEPFARFAAPRSNPETTIMRQQAVEIVMDAIENELTDRQRLVIQDVFFKGLPMDVVAKQLGSNRNALYKLIHDARLNLKKALARAGTSPEELLRRFSQN